MTLGGVQCALVVTALPRKESSVVIELRVRYCPLEISEAAVANRFEEFVANHAVPLLRGATLVLIDG